MKATWSFYDPASGAISTHRFMGSARLLEMNTPAGMIAIEGRFDHLSQMVDITTGKVIDYQPPAPDDNHVWNATKRRHVKKPEVIAAEHRDKSARARIAELEAKQQRAIREHLLGDTTATDRLAAIDDEIKALRPNLIRE